MANLEGRRVIQGGDLLLDGFDNRLAIVTGIHTPQTGTAVHDVAAGIVLVVHAISAHQHARCALEMAVSRKRHPECVHIEFGHVFFLLTAVVSA